MTPGALANDSWPGSDPGAFVVPALRWATRSYSSQGIALPDLTPRRRDPAGLVGFMLFGLIGATLLAVRLIG